MDSAAFDQDNEDTEETENEDTATENNEEEDEDLTEEDDDETGDEEIELEDDEDEHTSRRTGNSCIHMLISDNCRSQTRSRSS